MGVKLMTGATGEQNIQAADDRECLAGITGLNSYVFPTGNQLKATLVDANTVTIGTGAGSLQGSRFRCSTTTTVNIQSGTQGQFRHDVIGLHFSRETSGREGLEFQVLTGEPAASEGAAADPAYTAGDLLKGDAEAFMPLYRVKLSGINASDPEPLFSVLTPLATLGDSVSHTVLYKNPKGTIGNFTLGEAVTGFTYVDIYYKSGVVRMYPAAYSTVVLCANSFNPDGSLDVEGAALSFSGKAATFTNERHKLFYIRNGYAVFDSYTEVHPNLGVVLVLGYK